MTRDDLQELAMGVGMVKTPQGMIKPLWMASEAQLQAFAEAIIKDVKQSASEYVVQAIKKAVEYERNECAKVCEDYQWSDRAAEAIRARGEE
jgi:hypothetical protein